MSTQLILYPQNYSGEYNVTTTTYTIGSNEFVVDGINFSTINASSTYEQFTNDIAGILAAAPPLIINTWYRWRTPDSAPPAYPFNLSSELIMNCSGANQFSGVYQRLSNLVPGHAYDITVVVSSVNNESLDIRAYNGANLINFVSIPGAITVGTYTLTFTATAHDNTITVTSGSSVVGNMGIESISVLAQGAGTSTTLTEFSDGQVICDLYEDETIPLTLSVDDFKNVAEKVQSYSKAFKLPGTKRNNLIFGNIFDVTRADDGIVFNPYVKTKSVLKQDGFILFEGYLRLIDIQDKKGEISYNVNLYSEVVALADMLGDATFADLGFTELEHDYTRTNIKNSWNEAGTGIAYTNPDTSGERDDFATLKYPFVDWNHQILVANGSTGSAATLGDPELTLLEQGFRPFIQARYLIERIFNQAGFPFSYTSEFFNTDEFKKLYVDFNWGAENEGSAPDRTDTLKRETDLSTVQWLSQSFEAIQLQTFVSGNNTLWVAHRFVSDVANLQVSGSVRIQLSNSAASPRAGEMGFRKCNQGGAVIEYLETQSYSLAASPSSAALHSTFDTVLNSGEYLELVAKQNNAGATEVQVSTGTTSYFDVSYNNHAATVDSLLIKERGEMPQWDFLKGLMTMFNLVSIPDKSNPNNILIEPYNDIFLNNANSKQLDWTTKIDAEEIKLTPLTELNKKTIFKFVEDDDDYAFNLYKTSVNGGTPLEPGHLYGSLIFDASLSAQNLPTILTGEEEIIPEPFAATVPKPLMSQFFDFITPAIYSYNPDDGTTEGFANSPRIMYNNGVKTLTSCTYFIPAQNTDSAEQMTDFLQFSHLTDIPTVTTIPSDPSDTRDFHFGECQLINPIGNATTNNLFNLYWMSYFNELYNPNTRTMTLKVNLTPGDLNTFKFFDTVFIKNREFRVNKIDYKPGDLATVEFILII